MNLKLLERLNLSGHKNFIDQDGQDVAFDAGDFKFKIEELDQDGATLKKMDIVKQLKIIKMVIIILKQFIIKKQEYIIIV